MSNFESIKHTRSRSYPYREGFSMVPSAEQVIFFDDFVQKVTTNVPTGWSAAVIDVGATVTQAESDPHSGGFLNFVSDNAQEGATIYLDKHIRVDGRAFFMEVRFLTTAPSDIDFQFGLSSLNATTNPEDIYTTASTDLITFGVLDGDATVNMLCDKNNSGAAVNTGTIDIQTNTYHTLAILVNGSASDSSMSVRGYVDGNLAITWDDESEIPEDLVLAPFVGVRNGSNPGNDVILDYVRYSHIR